MKKLVCLVLSAAFLTTLCGCTVKVEQPESTNNIINIHLLQTNWKHCLHSFTELIIPYIYINTNMRFSNSYIWHSYYNIITFFSTALLKIKIYYFIYYFWLSSFIKYFCCILSCFRSWWYIIIFCCFYILMSKQVCNISNFNSII